MKPKELAEKFKALSKEDQMAVLRRLEQDFPTLEDVGCKVGIGVATGADKGFIGA